MLTACYSLSVLSVLNPGSCDESVVVQRALCLVVVNMNSIILYKVTIYFLFSVKPSGTRCYVDGPEEIGNDFKLKCEPKEGSLPLQYEWQKLSNSKKLPTLLVTVQLYVPEYSVVAFFTDITGEVISMKRNTGRAKPIFTGFYC